jgi:predicted MPP superfamily phosphohydrolase
VFFNEAKSFSAPYGVYGVLGNHDRLTDTQLSVQCMAEAGIILLDNNAVWIERGGEKIRVGGVGDLWTTTQDLQPTLEGTAKHDLMILVTHHPDYAELLPRDKIDLMLCGHTHNGQLWPFEYFVRLRYDFIGGFYKVIDMPLIVCRGTGTWGPRMRLWRPSEIVRITLKSPA